MGRPLKIKESTTIDIGFNAFDALTNPVAPATMTGTEYLGVVGGGYPSGIATATYPTVACTAFFSGGVGETPAYIITQKGTTKYLVASNNTITAGSFVVGSSYIIRALGNTNFTTVGAGVNPQVGDIFTATAVGSGTGTVSSVAICALANVAPASLSAGQMQITVNSNSVAFQASKLTNKFVWDYSTPNVRYAVNFFAGGAATETTDKSGAEIDTWANGTGLLTLGEVSDYTS